MLRTDQGSRGHTQKVEQHRLQTISDQQRSGTCAHRYRLDIQQTQARRYPPPKKVKADSQDKGSKSQIEQGSRMREDAETVSIANLTL